MKNKFAYMILIAYFCHNLLAQVMTSDQIILGKHIALLVDRKQLPVVRLHSLCHPVTIGYFDTVYPVLILSSTNQKQRLVNFPLAKNGYALSYSHHRTYRGEHKRTPKTVMMAKLIGTPERLELGGELNFLTAFSI